ncbi:unnamed protein product [Mytilus edulis]|uniref:Uncharacterized protein n=1 Tax=Mytilus edulis TaxID=6550 RepID=A0A8S3TMM9_MYTED|nr:unnamed protein product [Mytilus edulis]
MSIQFYPEQNDKNKMSINLRFNNQTDLMTIDGEEGKELDINCTSVTGKFITALKLEVNGSIIETGDNRSVNYSFTPDRTDHLSKYKCLDITHSSIKIEVTLNIRFPAMYSVYRLDHDSENGKLIRSVNLNNESFPFKMEMFAYQKNGRYTCVVSNGIPDNNGKVLQTWSTYFKYEDNRQLSKRKPMYFMIVSSIATVIFLYMITIHICFCVKHRKTRSQRHQNEHEDQMYHTYDEVETNSYRAVRTMQPQDTSDNQGKNPTSQHAASSSNETNENTQSTDNSTNDLNVNSLNAGLPQNEVTGVQRQRQYMSTTSDETNFSNTDLSKIPSNVVLNVNCIVNFNTTDAYENAEPSIDTKSQTSNDFDSESSTNVMVGNFGDGYEQPYQTVLQTRPESHRYVEIANERHTSISSTDSNKSEEQILQTGPTKKAVYTNLQL